jgi:hypothetical protein
MQLKDTLFRYLFHPAGDRPEKALHTLALAVLYLTGIVHWALFLNLGDVPFDLHDWQQAGAYYSFLKEAVSTGQFPLHMDSDLVTTDRYLGRPDTPLSPNIVLLRFLEPGMYTLVDTLTWYSIGFVGLALLKRRCKLSIFSFTIFFLLFNFNGHITAHISVGHTMWVGYFLLPFLALQLLRMLDHPRLSLGWLLATALVLSGMFMLGAFHMAIWCGLFMVILGVIYPRYLGSIVKVIALTFLLSLWRILPPIIEFGRGSNIAFLTGFPSLLDLLAGLVNLTHPEFALRDEWVATGWWEIDHYIGLLGLCVIVILGIYLPFRQRSKETVLFAPIFGVTLLSLGKIYQAIFIMPLPLLDSERVSARFFILPLVFLVVLSTIHLQRYLDTQPTFPWRKTAFSLGLLLILAHDLLQHSRLWRVSNLYDLFPSQLVDIRTPVVNYPDPVYTTSLAGGAVLSLLTLVVILAFIWRQRRMGKAVDLSVE